MRRTILGLAMGGLLLTGAVGTAVGASQSSPSKLSDQCARFHLPRPFESPRASDYRQCAWWQAGHQAR